MKGFLKQAATLTLTAALVLLSACGGAAPSPSPASSGSELPQTSSEAPPAQSESVVSIPDAKPAPRMISQDEFTHLSTFQNGYAFAVKGNEWGYLGLDGSFTPSITPTAEGVQVDDHGSFIDATILDKTPNPFPVSEEGFYPFLEDGKWGIKKMGEQSPLIPAELQYPAIFKNQRAVICRVIISGGSGKNGNMGADVAGRNEKLSVIDTDGKEVFAPKKTAQPYYANGLLTVELEDTPAGKLDVVDVNGNRVMEIKQDGMGGAPSMFGHTPYAMENLQLLNSAEGQPITFARTGQDGYTFVDPSGKELFTTGTGVNGFHNFRYDRVFLRNSSSNLWAMFDNTGKQLTEYIYAGLFYFRNPNYTLVQKAVDMKYYLIDPSGKHIGNFTFDTLHSLPQDNFVGVGVGATDARKVGALDGRGNIIVPMEYDGISECYNGFYWVEKDKVWTLKSLDGADPEFQTSANVVSLGSGCFAIGEEKAYKVMTVEAP